MNAPVDVTNIHIETGRLTLRAWRESDVEDFYEYARVDGVGQMAGWMPHTSIEESRKILELFIVEKKTFALELKENGKVIGSLGLEESETDMGLPESTMGRELGYVLSKRYWGRGLMPEAIKAVAAYCFETLHYDFLTAGHFLRNARSARMIEKCAFTFLFEAEHTMPSGVAEQIRTYILYNPNKEKRTCLN